MKNKFAMGLLFGILIGISSTCITVIYSLPYIDSMFEFVYDKANQAESSEQDCESQLQSCMNQNRERAINFLCNVPVENSTGIPVVE